MRVIAGVYRRRILQEVEESTTRSTKDRVKESIFNSLQNHLYDSSVLDLFAGSGALGIESISRGAKHVVFNELNPTAFRVVEVNVATLHIDHCTLSRKDYNDYLSTTNEQFDIIFLDPPYHMDVIDEIIQTIAKQNLLKEDGIIVCLYSKNNSLEVENNGIIEYKKKTIGVTNVSYMRWGNEYENSSLSR